MKPMHRYSRRYSQVVEAFDRGRWREAFELASHVVAELPNDAEMHFLGGVAAMQLYQLPIALSFLEKAVGLRPRSARYAAQYARALVISGLMPDAIAAADAAMASAEEWDASAYDTLGVIYSKGNMHGPAAEAFRRAVALAPRNANYRFNLGTSLMYYGDIEGAEREYEACLAADPEYWRGYLALSQLRRQSAECNHVERFSRLLERAPDPDAQLHLHLALAKEHEDLGAYSTAFGHYVKGKSAYGDLMGSSATDDAKVFDAIEEYFHGWRLAAQGHDSAEPILL